MEDRSVTASRTARRTLRARIAANAPVAVLAVITVLAVIAGGCAVAGPNYKRPALPTPAAWQSELGVGLSADPSDSQILASWWSSSPFPLRPARPTGLAPRSSREAFSRGWRW